ncbi:MAG TPA: AsmA-like C-terminal region-containing protein [Stellaceae bacterium]|nr:AsmA-like C-terminal region-containing protein [Stellaceae bacterium]
MAGVLILMAGFGIWRLMQGPVELDRLVPYVEHAFDGAGDGLGMTISGVRLSLDRTTHELHLWAENVRLALPDGEPVANFPEMATSFSPAALLQGRLAPTQVSIEHAVLHLKRHETGGITFRVGTATDDAGPDFGPQLIDQLIFNTEQGASLSSLRRLRIRDATVILDDKVTGQRWRATNVDAAMRRDALGVDGDVSLAFPLDASTAELRATFSYTAPTRKLDVTLNADGIDPVAVASLFPEARPLAQIHAPVAGALTTRLDLAAGRSEGIRLDLSFGAGRWTNGILPAGFLETSGGVLHAVYAPENSELRLERFALDLGGGEQAVLEGTLAGVTPEMLTGQAPPPADLAGKLGIKVMNIPMAKLDRLWPATFSPGGRRWVLANLRDGVIDQASAQLQLHFNAADYAAQVASAAGELRYHDISVNYFNGLPLARKLVGTASFAGNRMEFTPVSGNVKGLKYTGGSIQLTELGSPTEWATVDLNLSGPLSDVLDIIDNKPLHYAHAVGLDPAHVGGRTETQLHFRFPLVSDLKLDAVEYAAKSSLSGVSIAKAALDRNLSDGELALEVGPTGAHLKGTAQLDGVPITLDGETGFRHGGPKTRYRVGLRLDQDARRRLGLDIADEQLHGPIGAEVTYTAEEPGRGQAVAMLDLGDATLAIPDFGWEKPSRAPGSIKLVLDINKDTVVRLPEVEIKAVGLDGRFALNLGGDHREIDRVEIKRLVLGGSDITGTISRRLGGGWQASLSGPHFDASQLIKQTTPPGATPLAISGHFDHLTLSPRHEIVNVSAQMLRRAGSWQSVQIDGRYPNGHKLDLQIGGEGSSRRMLFTSNDLGATLALLGIADNVVGGEATISGSISEAGGKRTLRGHLEGSTYSLVRAPAFAQVLGMASLDGAAQLLAGGGVPFSVLRADFVYDGSRVALDRAVAYGSSLGLTANGNFDIDRDLVELQGTIAPAYALNSLLGIGSLPLIGDILTGGEGQGLLAANYRLSGPAADPQVSVNPLSALAPGFLRQLFQFALPPAQAQQQPAPVQPAQQ